MALTNYEKQKRWREKNRALYNFQQRQRRKKDFPVAKSESTGAGVAPKSGVPFSTKKVGEFRMLVLPEEEKPRTESPAAPTVVGGIYRNDSGGVISKFAWEKLQRLKEKAKEGGYVLDEWSQ